MIERSIVEYWNISLSGTLPVTDDTPPGRASISSTTPRRDERSPITSPVFSSGHSISIFMIGSSSRELPSDAIRKASTPAASNAITLESTSCDWPS